MTLWYWDCNNNPVAHDDTAETAFNTAVKIDVLANDTDPDCDKLRIFGTPTSTHGSVVVNSDGTLTFTPAPGFAGTAEICYTVSDGNGGHDSATVHIQVDEEKPDGIVEGTSGNDLIDAHYTGDPQGDMVDHNDAILPHVTSNDDIIKAGAGNDTVFAGAGNDSVDGGAGNDLIYGQGGNDTLNGDSGNDTIYGDNGGIASPPAADPVNQTVDWGNFKTDCGKIEDQTVDLGDTKVAFDFTVLDHGATASYTNTTEYTGGATFDAHSGLKLYGCGGEGGVDPTSLTTLTFSSDNSDYTGEVQNTSFRINDLDRGNPSDNHVDVVTLQALDGDGKPVDIKITPSGHQTVSYDATTGTYTITGTDSDTGSLHSDDAVGSVLVEIADPTAKLSIGYANGANTDQAITITDIHCETVPVATDTGEPGNDVISGGTGGDVLYGEQGNDTLSGDAGNDSLNGGSGDDTVMGGSGNDTLVGGTGSDSVSGGDDRDLFIVDSQADGVGDTLDGGQGGDNFDTLDLTGAGPLRVDSHVTAYDPVSGVSSYAGTVTFLDSNGNPDGTLQFSNMERVIPCFTPGTLIATPKGEVPAETLKEGDKVLTRDNGIQEIRWAGRCDMTRDDLADAPHLAPVLIKAGSLGNDLPERDMLVSPNHRMLVANDKTALYFEEHEVLVAAKHLIGNAGIAKAQTLGTSYLHFMFDRHEVILGNGAWTESFQPGDMTLGGMGNSQRQEIFELFPALQTSEGRQDYQAARKTLKKHETAVLLNG
ncbi:Hint domain-containing protein [uncultured Thioclava sp.]|uniref:Hint domain-containing protein n=1 Tax=uncultured Thioclava sp. TaxID=473858 RepID=UPI0025CF2547|nr:Hint domain-containing protein [uncultured Thioclava sp.]